MTDVQAYILAMHLRLIAAHALIFAGTVVLGCPAVAGGYALCAGLIDLVATSLRLRDFDPE